MGLCIEERLSGLMYAVNSITNFGSKTRLRQITTKAWHALLGNETLSFHWFAGSPTSNSIQHDSCDPWGLGVLARTKKLLEKPEPENNHKWFEQSYRIQDLLGAEDKELSGVFEVYRWTEQAVYYLRRHDDKFRKERKTLDKLLSDIQGACFDIFKENEAYSKAYIINLLLTKFILYENFPYCEEEWDDLTKWAVSKYTNAHFSKGMKLELEELSKIHMSLEKDKSVKNRASCLLKLMRQGADHFKKDTYLSKFKLTSVFESAKKIILEEKADDERSWSRQSSTSIYGYKWNHQ